MANFFDDQEPASSGNFFDDGYVAPKPKSRNPLAFANDTVIELANAVAGGIGAIGDFVSPGNRASAAINEFVQSGEEKQSDITKADRTKFRESLDQSQGVSDDFSAVGQYLLNSPVQAAAQAVGSFAGPGLAVAGGRAGAAALGATAKMATRVGRGAGIATGAAMGGGDAAGDAYALVQNMPDDVLLTNKEVARLHAAGKSLDEIREEVATMAARKASVLPAIAGGAAGAFGAEKLLAGGVARAGARGAVQAGLVEGAGEAAEEGLSQFEGRRAAQEYDPSIDPTKNVAAMAAMGGVMGFGAGAGVNALSAKPQERLAEVPAAAEPLLLENRPDPFISFPDGSVGKQSDVDAFIAALPEGDRLAARARLYGMEEQPVTPEDVLQAQSVEQAIAIGERAIQEATPFEREKKNAEIDAAWQAYQADITAQRDQSFQIAEQARRDADVPAMQAQQQDQTVDLANAITTAQGFDESQPSAMQLAFQRAQSLRQERLAEAQQRATIQAQPIENGVQNERAAVNQPEIGAGMDAGNNAITTASGNSGNDQVGTGDGAPDLRISSPKQPILTGDNIAESASNSADARAPSAGASVAEPNVGATGGKLDVVSSSAADSAKTVDQAKAILTAAGVTGNERMEALRNIRSGVNTLEDLIDAHPPKAKEAASADANTDAAEVPIANKRTASTAVSAGEQSTATGGRAPVSQPVEVGQEDTAQAELSGGDSVSGGNEAVQQPAALKSSQQVMGEEEYLASKGASRQGLGDAALHRSSSNVSEKSRRDSIERQSVLDDELMKRREELRKEYREKVAAGDLRAPTLFEEMERRAQGHPDNESTQAARRLLAKREKRMAEQGITGKESFAKVERQQSRLEAEIEKARANAEARKADLQDKREEFQGFKTGDTVEFKAGFPFRNMRGQIVSFVNDPVTGSKVPMVRLETGQTRPYAEVLDTGRVVDGDKPRKSEAPAKGGMRADDVNRSLTMLRAKWMGSSKVNTVQSLDDLPTDVRERAGADEKTEGLFDPKTGQVYLVADNISSPERAAFAAAHERIGHGGLRALKDKTVNEALNMASANKFVKDLAAAIQQDRSTASPEIEEAVAELAAAIETGGFQGLADRYGVNVPSSARNGLRGTIARVLDAIKRFLASAIGKPVSSVSDADVRALIGAQREAVSQGDAGIPASEDAQAEPVMQSRAPSSGAWSIGDFKYDDLIYSLQNKQIDMKRVVDAIRASGKAIADNFNAYLQEELFYGRSAKGVKDFLDTELRPLMQDMQARGVEMSDFEEYLWNRHAEERNDHIASLEGGMQDKGSGIATKDARTYLSALPTTKRTAYEALAKRIDAINAKTRQILVASGLEKQSTINAWEGAYQHYVPLQREDMETGGTGTGQGFSIKGSASKRAVGSDKPVADIIANIAMQRERQIVRAEKNRVSTALLGLATENPNADFWDVDNAPTERVVELRGGKDTVVERIVPGFRSRDNVVMARINGEDHFITFNEKDPRAVRMAQSIKNLDADQLGRVLSAASKATRYLAAINTQYNPIFGIINLMRDTQGAMLNLSTTPIAGEQKKVLGYTASALLGIYADLRAHRAGKQPTSAWANLFEEFQNEGGQTGYRDQYGNAEQRSEAIAKEIKSLNQHPALKAGGAVFRWLSDYNESMENAVRLAAYRTAKESGMSNQQAASVAKNLTVNFNRKGQVATQVGALYAFFNASTQGTARLAETLTGPMGKKIITGGILLGAMQAMLLASSDMGEDEPPEFVRSRSLILPIGDKKYLTLPMPLGFHVLPNLGRIPMEFMLNGFRNPTKRVADLVGVFADTFNPIGNAGISLQTIAPSVVDPFAALAENRDWTGKQIARGDMNSLAPTPGYTRANDTATSWSKAIAYGLNILSGGTDYKQGLVSPTPDQLDYLIGQATGGVGRELSKAEQVVSSTITGEDLPIYKIPLVGRFVGNASGQAAESGKFYSAVKRINEHEAEIKGLREERKTAEVLKYINENREALLVPIANKTEYELRKLKRSKREAVEAGRTEQVKIIEARIAATMAQFNKRVEAARKE